ncbi:MAG TPA: carboxypeptidase-like regulatory domain-containing protein, partial [Flavobacteriales bacterium]|nr:carboxypeptidase-like regulatory domain-containing protein [Flavobacteriales bacterium]
MPSHLQRLALAIGFALIGLCSFAQTGTIRGFVYDKATGEPIIFTNVVLKGTTIGAATDVNGYFSITKVPVGPQTLRVTFLGYEDLEKAVTVGRDQI